MYLTRLAVKYPTLTLVAALIIIIWGLNYFLTMSKREDPEMTILGCRIITVFPGAIPEDIEQYVTKPIEDVAAELEDVEEIQSESRNSISVVLVLLDHKTTNEDEVDQIWDTLRAKLAAIQEDLPAGCSAPYVDNEFADTSSHIIAVSGEHYTPRELAAFADRIQNRLSKLPDAGRVEVWAERPERIFLEFDDSYLSRYFGVNLNMILGAISGTNIMMPGGEMETGGLRYSVDSSGTFDSTRDIINLPVYGTPGGPQVRLGDLGRLRYGYEEPPSYIARANGSEAVIVNVVLKSGKNVISLGQQVQEELEQIRKSLPADLSVSVIHDQPGQVIKRINIFLNNLYSGIALVIIVVFLFMGFRPSVPVGLAIPLVIITSFAVMSITGTTLQQMSIAGLIIALGMLVDNAIVVTDNVSRYLDAGAERREAAVKATQELAMPILTSSLTTVCAFLPLALLPGETGQFVGDIAIVVSIAILTSYAIALTITPTICSYVLVNTTGRRVFRPLDPLMKLMERWYPPMLHWTQRNIVVTGLLVTGAFAGMILLFPLLGVQFFPGAERDQFAIDVFLPDGSSFAATEQVCRELEALLDEEEDVTSYLVNVGSGGPMYYYNRISQTPASNYADVLVNTQSPEATAAVIPRLRAAIASNIAGARIQVKALEQGPPVGAPLQILVRGNNIDELKRIGSEIKQLLATTANVIDIRDSFGNDSRQLRLMVNEEQLRSIGATRQDINQLTAMLLSGYEVTEYRAPSRTIPVMLKAFPDDRNAAGDLNRLYLHNKYTGTPVPLSSIASFETVNVTSKIQRVDRVRELEVSAYTAGGRLAADVMQELRPRLAELELPPGYEVAVSGETEESAEAFGDLGSIMAVAILLILLILVAQFKSVRISVVVFLAVPLSLIGAVLGLFVTGWPFGFTAGLGVLSLAGIVINNSIVLMDFIMERLKQGHSLDESISLAGQTRLRPILLTTATTIGGLLPLGLYGGSMWAPMSFAIIGGLIVSTFLTLIVVPLLFRLVAAKRALQLTQGDAGQPADTE